MDAKFLILFFFGLGWVGRPGYNLRCQLLRSVRLFLNLQVIGTIESNQVTIVQGATGSGKTTQVPQYILDHYAKMGRYCNIIVTQPRRIAAMSIARRVCSERRWQIGTLCGYQVIYTCIHFLWMLSQSVILKIKHTNLLNVTCSICSHNDIFGWEIPSMSLYSIIKS